MHEQIKETKPTNDVICHSCGEEVEQSVLILGERCTTLCFDCHELHTKGM